MKFLGWRGPTDPSAGGHADRGRRRRIDRRAVAVACALLMPALTATEATAATQVVKTNPGNLTAVGPINTLNGFPAWYQDKAGTRVEPCLDRDNALCGFLPGDIPADGPIAFPGNFPEEFFYQVVGATITGPGAFRAVLTIGLEGAFANGAATPGDQQVFARTRIVVKGAPPTQPNAPLLFTTPFGTATVDIDASGAGRLVEDKTPAVGNFTTPLAGNFGPFLRWDTGTIKDSSGEYLGDPNVAHAVTGSPFNTNVFSVSGAVTGSTPQFTVSGKVATNTGVRADAATATPDKQFIDVFATSGGEQLQVEPLQSGGVPTPMLHDPKSDRFYARLQVPGGTLPADVTVTNIADKPQSQSKVAVKTPTGLTISKAEFDGGTKKLTVTASSTTPTDALTVTGFGALANGTGVFDTVSPPATVEVTTGTAPNVCGVTAPVTIANGVVTPAQPPVPPTDPGPGTAPAAPANLTATPGVTNVNLAWNAVAGATKYQVTVYTVNGTTVTKAATQPVAVTGTPPATTQNVVGLTANTAYRFTVTATTGAGTSAESAPANAATTGDTVTITTARFKTTDFRVVGTTSAATGTVNVYGVDPRTNPTAPPLAGMTNVQITSAAPAAGGAFDARVRTGAIRPASGQVWVKTSNGAVSAPATLT